MYAQLQYKYKLTQDSALKQDLTVSQDGSRCGRSRSRGALTLLLLFKLMSTDRSLHKIALPILILRIGAPEPMRNSSQFVLSNAEALPR